MAQMFVAGEYQDSESRETTEIRNPATGEVVDTVPKGTVVDARRAIEVASDAFDSWSRMSPAKRGSLLFEAGRLIKDKEKDLAALLTQEQGKPIRESFLEIRRFVHTLEHYAGMAKCMRGGYVNLDDGRYGIIMKKPMGVVGSIVPWNFPVSLMGNKIGPALLAGNTMVIKPAGSTPLTATRCVELIHKAGLPKGAINIVTGPGGIVGEEILQNSKIRKIGFTGETGTGKHVMEVASKEIKRVTLELGGSDPMIVCDDADLDRAVSAASVGRFFNCGQA
ncbi:MAG: aldehyde dehydrogenase family protein, partial [Candidatus Binatia bacterium]